MEGFRIPERFELSSKRFLTLSFLCIVLSIFVSSIAGPAVAASAAPQSVTLDGQLFDLTANSQPLLDNSVLLVVQIMNPNLTCVLYEEQQTLNTTSTNGYFNIQVGTSLGSGKRTTNDPGNTMAKVFQNYSAITATNSGCGGSYTPVSGDIRYLRMIVTPSKTGQAETLNPDLVLDSVPHAIVAESLQGLDRSQVLQLGTTPSLTQTNLENVFSNSNYPLLTALLAGTSFLSSTGGTLSGGLTITSGGATVTGGISATGGINMNSGSITNTTAVTGSSALTVSAGGAAQNLILSSSTTGSVNIGSGNGTSLKVLDGGAGDVNFVTVKGAAAGSSPTIATGGSDTNINLTIAPSGTGNTIFSSGYVGIGTTNPGGIFDVQGGTAAATTDGTPINLYAQNGGTGNQNGGNINLITGTHTGTGHPGSVSVGTITPVAFSTMTISPLMAAYDSLVLKKVYSTDQNTVAWYPSGALNATNVVWNMGTQSGTNTDHLFIKTWDGTTVNTRLSILDSGNVGIGTSSPQATLSVDGYMQLKVYSLAPAVCSATYDGALALTSQYTTCVCKGASNSWVRTTDGATACTW